MDAVRKLEIGPEDHPFGAPPEWEYFDKYQWFPDGKWHIGDAADLSRFADNTFHHVYSNQVLEHFSHLDTERIVQEWFRVVKKDGLLTIKVPNFDGILEDYLNDRHWDHFVKRLYGGQNYDGNMHLTMFHYEHFRSSIRAWLQNGFIVLYKDFADWCGIHVEIRK